MKYIISKPKIFEFKLSVLFMLFFVYKSKYSVTSLTTLELSSDNFDLK